MFVVFGYCDLASGMERYTHCIVKEGVGNLIAFRQHADKPKV